MWKNLILMVVVVYCCSVSVLAITSEITEHPTSQSSLLGSNITFKCKISNLPAHGEDVVQWTKNGLLISFKKWYRYSITGDHSQGHYDLTISNIQLEDEASFECQATINRPNREKQQLRSESVTLTVIVPSTKHAMNGLDLNKKYKNVGGKALNISCTAYNSRPPAKLNWLIDGRKVSQDKFIEKEINSKKFEGFMLYNTTSYLILERNTINDNQKFTCQLEPLFPSLKSQNITFVTKLIKIPKTPLLLISNHNDDYINEKSTIIFMCITSEKEPHVFRWFKNGTLIKTEKKGTYEIKFIDRSWHNVNFSCCVENEVGCSEKQSQIINMKFSSYNILVIVGISVGVFVFICIICAAAYCHINKRNQKLNTIKEENDQLQYNDKSPINIVSGGNLNVSVAKFSTASSNNHSFSFKDLTSSQISSIHSCSSNKNNDDGYSTGGTSQIPLSRKPTLPTPEPISNNLTNLSPISRLQQLSYGFPSNTNVTSFTLPRSDNFSSDGKQRRCSSATEDKQVFSGQQTPSPILQNYFLGNSKFDPKSMGDGVNFVPPKLPTLYGSSRCPPPNIDLYKTPNYQLFVTQQERAKNSDPNESRIRPTFTSKCDGKERMSTLV